MSIKITFMDSLPESGSGLCFHFNKAIASPSCWQEGDVHSYIRANEDRWLLQLENWHIELSRKAASISPLWWIMPASRIVSWHPPVTDKLFFAIAVIELIEAQGTARALVIGCPPQAARFLRELRPQWIFETQKSPNNQVTTKNGGQIRKLINKLCSFFWKTTANTFRRWPGQISGNSVVYSHAMSAKALQATGDHFFSRSLDGLVTPSGATLKPLWLYLFVAQRPTTKQDILKVIHEAGSQCVFIDDALGWLQLISVVRLIHLSRAAAVKIREEAVPLQIDSYSSRLFLAEWLDPQLGDYRPFNELMIYVAAKRLFRSLRPDVLFYPYEEKGLERSLLKAANETHVKRTIGFAHAVHNKGHLYMRDRHSVGIAPPLPDFIATTGPAARDWLVSWGSHSSARLSIVGSPRHTSALPPPNLKDRPFRALVIISAAHELPVLASMISAHRETFDGWELVIRRYPYGWHEEQDRGIKRLKDCGVSLKIDDEPLKTQLAAVHAVLFCSTSAGLEAMLSERLTIYLNLNEILDLDPIAGKGDSTAVFKAQNLVELKAILQRINSMSPSEYERQANQQRSYAESIYAPAAFQNALTE